MPMINRLSVVIQPFRYATPGDLVVYAKINVEADGFPDLHVLIPLPDDDTRSRFDYIWEIAGREIKLRLTEGPPKEETDRPSSRSQRADTQGGDIHP